MSHPESEHGLRVQLATALRERDEARTDAANLRFANDKARATTEKLWLERDELRAVAVNANKQTADVNALRLKQDEELVALRAQVQAWKDGVCQDCVEKDEAIAAARRECAEQCEAKEAAYSHIYKLRDALERCSELFSTIRGDWTDPRSECREGQDVIRKALAAPGAASGEDSK